MTTEKARALVEKFLREGSREASDLQLRFKAVGYETTLGNTAVYVSNKGEELPAVTLRAETEQYFDVTYYLDYLDQKTEREGLTAAEAFRSTVAFLKAKTLQAVL